MTVIEYTLAGLLLLLLLLTVAYLLGWSFSAGYHNHKIQHTKRLMELLREGNTTQ